MSYPISLSNPELWRKIEAFQIDGGNSSLTFAARLARENGWTIKFAERVVGEYKRFVYLAMEAGHRVTPSEHVDQAWHLHMLYTHSYWERMSAILPRALMHTPTKGGEFEDAKFDDWYERTREAYEREFGSEPAREIWPDSGTRFGHDLQWRRVNTDDCWVLPKRRVLGVVAVLAAGVGMTACGVGATSIIAAQGTGTNDFWFVVGVFVVLLAIVVVIASITRRGGGPGNGGGSWFGGGGGSSGCGDSGCGGGGCGGGGCGGGD